MWSDSSLVQYRQSRKYRVRYKCSKDSTWNTTEYLLGPKLTLNSNSFQNYMPNDLCRFCVTARAFDKCTLDSEPLCQDIRLHEEPPSSAPNITCPLKDCQFTRDAHARNVSITWTLPPRRDWNGVLTEVRVFYRNGLESVLKNFSDDSLNNIRVPIRNNTSNGQTLLTGLSPNHTYWIDIVTCNKEGCSPPGKTFKLRALPLIPSHTKRADSAAELSTRKMIILLVCTAAILLTGYFIYVSYTWVQTQRQLPPKIELRLCEPSGYDVIMDNVAKAEYDVLMVTHLPTYVDIRQMNTEC